MNAVDEYVNNFDGVKKEWLTTFVSFMRQNYPDIQETISYQMPTYKFNHSYIAFSARAKDHFSYHSLDFEMIEALKGLLPNAEFGKGCAKIRYDDTAAIPILFDMSRKIIDRNRSSSS